MTGTGPERRCPPVAGKPSWGDRGLRPTPLGPPLSLRVEPVEVSESAIAVTAELAHDGKVRATMAAEWLRFHPREGEREPGTVDPTATG